MLSSRLLDRRTTLPTSAPFASMSDSGPQRPGRDLPTRNNAMSVDRSFPGPNAGNAGPRAAGCRWRVPSAKAPSRSLPRIGPRGAISSLLNASAVSPYFRACASADRKGGTFPESVAAGHIPVRDPSTPGKVRIPSFVAAKKPGPFRSRRIVSAPLTRAEVVNRRWSNRACRGMEHRRHLAHPLWRAE